jgi:ferrous iron transport protein B
MMDLYKLVQLKKVTNQINSRYKEEEKEKIRDRIVEDIYNKAEKIAKNNVKYIKKKGINWDDTLDNILTSRITGFPIMLLLLGGIFWLTIIGANYPSQLLAEGLFWLEDQITILFNITGAPFWLYGILIQGIYRTMAWVISVMLPPMAIFFPLFTLLEDLGYLPRVAFNLDNLFKRAGAHGKQSLTMSMGFGCNAAGVIATRIIDSPREKLIAILTNTFVPCNGRFPTLIILSSLFLGSSLGKTYNSIIATSVVVALVLLGIFVTLIISWLLSKTLLKGVPSTFTLELPPYRKPQVGRIIVRSFLDRTLFVLWRAIIVAAPAGAVIWVLANISINGLNIITYIANLINPFAILLGMDGFILMAFFLGLPANEIVIPLLVMNYLSAGVMIEPGSTTALKNILVDNGWTWITALSTMIFSLLHFPCGTTLLTIKKETGSIKWTVFAALMPLVIAISVSFLFTQIIHLFI